MSALVSAPVARQADELRDLALRFSSVTESALMACTARDEAALFDALEERDRLTVRMGTVVGELAAARRVLRKPSAVAEFDAVLLPGVRAAQSAARLSAVLAARAVDFRAEIGRQIERLNQDDAALSAYAAPPRGEAVAIDTTR